MHKIEELYDRVEGLNPVDAKELIRAARMLLEACRGVEQCVAFSELPEEELVYFPRKPFPSGETGVEDLLSFAIREGKRVLDGEGR